MPTPKFPVCEIQTSDTQFSEPESFHHLTQNLWSTLQYGVEQMIPNLFHI